MNTSSPSYKNSGWLIPAILLMILFTEGKSQVISGEKKTIKIKETSAREQTARPTSYLEYNVVFKDRNGNGILEADESGSLEVEIVNNSMRTAYDVRVTCSESDRQTKGLQVIPMVEAGDILAKESKKVNIAVSADNQIKSNEIRLMINIADRSGAKAASEAVTIFTRPRVVSFSAKWLSPETNDTSVFDPLMVIKLQILSSSFVKNIILLNNDTVQVINYSLTRNDPYYSLTYFQRLEPGSNMIELRFDNEDNQHLTVTRNVFYFNEKRMALLIGNADYTFGSLSNPVNDVRAMEEILSKVGFEVMKYENLTQKDLKKAIDNFGTRLSGYDVGLFYYAGHGIQANGFNYLIPVDAKLTSYEDIDYDCVQADRILGKMEYAATKVNIIILDACRNNPFERQWTRSTSGKGLAFMDAPSGSMIAYATSPGRTAADGSGKNGLYTSMLLKYIQQKGLQIEEVFKNVRREVESQSGGSQIPWESTSLKGQFYFRR
jgi:hypothetical protein